MVLLARRTLQEHAYRKGRLGCAGEGIEIGSSVSVLSGRNFPLFNAGDAGRVVRVDKEALNCDVLFDGATEPVPVAFRHLELKGRHCPEPKLCRSDEDSKVQNKMGDEHGEDDKLSVDPGSCGHRSNSVAPEVALVDTLTITMSKKRPQASVTLSSDPASGHQAGWQHRSTFTDRVAPEESPEHRTNQEMPTISKESGDNAHDHPAPGKLCGAEDAEFGGVPTFSLVRHWNGDSVAIQRVESLQAELEAMEERHRIEMASLRAELEEAQEFGRKQQARATFLEQHIRLLSSQQVGVSTPSASPSTAPGHPSSATAAAASNEGQGHGSTQDSGSASQATQQYSVSASSGALSAMWPNTPTTVLLSARTSARAQTGQQGDFSPNAFKCSPSRASSSSSHTAGVSAGVRPYVRRMSSSPSCQSIAGGNTPTGASLSMVVPSSAAEAISGSPAGNGSIQRAHSASATSRPPHALFSAVTPRQPHFMSRPVPVTPPRGASPSMRQVCGATQGIAVQVLPVTRPPSLALQPCVSQPCVSQHQQIEVSLLGGECPATPCRAA